MKFFARLLIAAVVFSGWASVDGLVPHQNFALLTLQPADAQAYPSLPKPPTPNRTTSTGHRFKPIPGGKTYDHQKPLGRLHHLRGKNPVVHYFADEVWAQALSQAIVDGRFGPTDIFEKVDFEGAHAFLVNLKKAASDPAFAVYQERKKVRLAVLEIAPKFREKVAERLHDLGGVFLYGELASSKFDQPHFRILLTSFFKLGGREDMARWAASAASSHLTELHHDIVHLRILDGAFSLADVNDRDEFPINETNAEITLPTKLTKAPQTRNQTPGSSFSTDEKERLRDQENGSKAASDSLGGGAGEGGSIGGESGGPSGSFGNGPTGSRTPLQPVPSHDQFSEKPVQALPKLKLALVDDGACLSGWRGELSVPFGEFAAVLRGDFAEDGIFYARDVADNQAAFDVLDRLIKQRAVVLTFYGCGTKFQTVQSGWPIRAMISKVIDQDRCRKVRNKWLPSQASTICVASEAGYRGYEVRSVARMAGH